MSPHVYPHRIDVAVDYRRNECGRVGGAYRSYSWVLKGVISSGSIASPVVSFSTCNGGRLVWEHAP
jgi:hypothetical protein